MNSMMKKHGTVCIRNISGFSLIELIVYLGVISVLMTLVFISFTDTVRRNVQQSGIAETKIETLVGFDLLRLDLEHAGFGLPWQFQGTPNYSEPGGALAALADSPSAGPRAINSAEASASSLNNSDYLVLRGTNIITDVGNISGQKWGYVGRDAAHAIDVQSMTSDAFVNTEGVIVLRPESSATQFRQLIMSGATYVTTKAAMAGFAPAPTPNDPNGEKYLVYGLNSTTAVQRPFNRTDYYVATYASIGLLRPEHCEPTKTGVLVKAQLNQIDNNFGTILPIIDCVADFQIVYYLDTNNDGGWDTIANANALTTLDADQVRDRVKAVRFYILSHEGGLDRSYTRAGKTINVGDVAADGATLQGGRNFDLDATIGGNWANYRWKVDSIAATPSNLK